MLSRVADATYWMYRYIERAENYARFMDVNFNLLLEMPPDLPEQWKPLIVTTGDFGLYQKLYGKVEKSRAIFFMGFDSKNPNSIYNCLVNARENARAIRPEITREVWEQINALYYLVKKGVEGKYWKKKDPRSFFIDIKVGCQLLYGIFNDTLSRSDSWHFGNVGKLLERADKTSRVLDVKYHILLPDQSDVGSPLDLIQWAALLKSVSAYDMYRKKYGKLSASNIAEFLIFDYDFPRAIGRCLQHAEEYLNKITNTQTGFLLKSEKQLGMLKSKLEYSDINDVFSQGMHEFLDNLQSDLNQISALIFEDFFSIENAIKKS